MRSIIPLPIVASVADRAMIEPSTGPMQGVQPKANAVPTINGKKRLFLNELVSNLFSFAKKRNFRTPRSCKEKIIIIMPAIILSSEE